MSDYKPGSNIDGWCTKCKLILAHTIEAVANNVVKRVQCNTCGGKHMHKANAPGTKKASSTTKKAGTKTKKASDYARLLNSKNIETAQKYSVKHTFKKGDVISHKHFGLGVVIEEKDSSKIEVLFETGSKILVHGRS